MRITIENISDGTKFMRRAGYGFQKEGGGEIAFVRRVSGGPFPRYHAYTTHQNGQLTINLHVDQKAPSYERGKAHAGEYDGSLVAQEIARLQEFASRADTVKPEPSKKEDKGFFGRLFS
jgi:hypothetical protein